jgi:hypothetical protein
LPVEIRQFQFSFLIRVPLRLLGFSRKLGLADQLLPALLLSELVTRELFLGELLLGKLFPRELLRRPFPGYHR